MGLERAGPEQKSSKYVRQIVQHRCVINISAYRALLI